MKYLQGPLSLLIWTLFVHEFSRSQAASPKVSNTFTDDLFLLSRDGSYIPLHWQHSGKQQTAPVHVKVAIYPENSSQAINGAVIENASTTTDQPIWVELIFDGNGEDSEFYMKVLDDDGDHRKSEWHLVPNATEDAAIDETEKKFKKNGDYIQICNCGGGGSSGNCGGGGGSGGGGSGGGGGGGGQRPGGAGDSDGGGHSIISGDWSTGEINDPYGLLP